MKIKHPMRLLHYFNTKLRFFSVQHVHRLASLLALEEIGGNLSFRLPPPIADNIAFAVRGRLAMAAESSVVSVAAGSVPVSSPVCARAFCAGRLKPALSVLLLWLAGLETIGKVLA